MIKQSKNIEDLKIVSYYSGYITLGTSSLMVVPLVTSILLSEWNTALDFVISINIAFLTSLLLLILGQKSQKKLEWKHGLIIASLSWVILTILCAVPYYLSGHTKSFLDAAFDVMSGFTTTGLALTQDLDHLSLGLNMWRHILTFVGGQGMVVLALTFLVKDTVGAYKMYVGEGKDIELQPNVKNTAKIIWIISMVYLLIGTFILWINGMFIGLKPVSALFHGLFIFMSAWSTGGFAPMAQNILYYHSFSYEIITIIFFIIGSFNFGLHYTVWKENKKELVKNIEVQSFFITATLTAALAVFSLSKLNIYPNAVALLRKGVYNLLSAHTTTGFSNIYARQFALEWGDFGVMMLIIAMLFGGAACSTAGGFKGLRVGIIFKGIVADVKKMIGPERRVKLYKFHHMKDYVLEDGMLKSAAFIIICYMTLFSIGTAIGTYYGYPLTSAAFEAASVTGNVGLSIGVTSPSMPTLMKVYYIIAMYLGRLEFISVFALIGFIFGGVKNLCLRYSRR
ncbi:Trk system potassium uptake protein TrkG [Clostridium homopropionicum DSM 5847]|uniref:Trk system potassium uptake protein TrkG n=1 Tax=Clostridium homopropionicum DSM 5847 TaxID=1121318 RepID=A0A0L6Z5E0_9CLOT|nr:potassium transporter TrkG [Clostridium homopropionicum]KOA18176.1 Trk system potassium uptake protein TrkG [Clostridium homopropionicum DSM 5847]SFF71843.1 trk system potassium uptake protein TrkH [Clostridium homopropionicum]